MGEQRTRGVVLYTCAALLLVGGGAWWFGSAPHQQVDPQIEQWRRDAERLLPNADDQDDAATMALASAADREVTVEVGVGEYQVTVLCVGGAGSQVRVSLGEAGSDSGHGLTCGEDREADNFTVGTAGQLRMNVTVNDAGPVVFRYSLQRES